MAWIEVARRAAVAKAGMIEVEAGSHAVLLYDIDDAVYATAAICPHHAAWLSQGGRDGDFVDCPRHQGRFHIPTGALVRGPACDPLRVYTVRVEGDAVLIEI